jgi:hypothetical protein
MYFLGFSNILNNLHPIFFPDLSAADNIYLQQPIYPVEIIFFPVGSYLAPLNKYYHPVPINVLFIYDRYFLYAANNFYPI